MLYSNIRNTGVSVDEASWVEMVPETIEENTVYYTWTWPTPATQNFMVTHIFDVSHLSDGAAVRISTIASGASYARVIPVDVDGNRLGSQINHTVRNEAKTFYDYEWVLPTGTVKLYVMGKLGAPKVKEYRATTSQEKATQAVRDYRDWSDKTILWLGTSIPAGSGYPEKIAMELGANLYNRSVGSSHIRTHKTDGSIATSWDTHTRSLGWSIADFDAIIADLAGTGINAGVTNIPASLDANQQDTLYQNSYENAVIPLLNGTRATADIVVIDHGINDFFMDQTNIDQLPTSEADFAKTHFGSAFNWLVELIREHNPNAQIFMVSHWHTQSFVNGLQQAHTAISDYLGVPLINIWDGNWNQPTTRVMPGTTTPVLNHYVPDGLHYYTSDNPFVVNSIANKIKEFLIANVAR